MTIYTAKKEEYDLLQHLFTINSYKTKGYSRYHGFGNNLQYQLYISDKQFYSVSATKFARKVTSNGGDYWCINVDNHNFFTRTHKGNVYLTGNCHGYLVPEDNYINVCMEHTDYKPVTFKDLPDLQERQIELKRNL